MGCQKQTCDDVNECLKNNGGCDQKCLNNAGSFNCMCIQGWELFTKDGTSNTTPLRLKLGFEMETLIV